MEDSVPEAKSLLHPTSLTEDEVVIEERENPQIARPEGEERASGFINHLISNLVPGGDTHKEKRDKNGDEETVTDPEGGKKEEKRGGVVDHIISNLVNPLSPRTGNNSQGNFEAVDVRSENEAEKEVGGGGEGLTDNIVSNLFHHSEGEVGESKKEKEEEEMVGVGGENKAEKTEGRVGEGGIIDNIVSHLPTSIPDDAAPTIDEATILIHIVQD